MNNPYEPPNGELEKVESSRIGWKIYSYITPNGGSGAMWAWDVGWEGVDMDKIE